MSPTPRSAPVSGLVFNTGSVVPPEPTGHLHLDLKRNIEAYCAQIGLPTIALRPRLYFEVLAAPWVSDALLATGTLAYPLPAHHRASWGTVEDVAALAVAALERPELAGSAFEVGGPRPLSGTDLAAAFSRAWRRPIRYHALTVAEFEAGLQQGLGEHVGTVIAESFHYFDRIGPDGLAVDDAAATADGLGVKLTALEAWIHSQDWATTRIETSA